MMVTVRDVVSALGLKVYAAGNLGREVTGGYASDLLSCVMARAKEGNVWVTLQSHPNVVAVASLLNLAAVITTEGVEPDHDTLARAHEAGVTLLGSADAAFGVVVRLGQMGIAGV